LGEILLKTISCLPGINDVLACLSTCDPSRNTVTLLILLSAVCFLICAYGKTEIISKPGSKNVFLITIDLIYCHDAGKKEIA
jgi:hypothetical protein